jgi:hypothetical protein
MKNKKVIIVAFILLVLSIIIIFCSYKYSKLIKHKDGYMYYNDEKYIKLDENFSYIIPNEIEKIKIGTMKTIHSFPTVYVSKNDEEQNLIFSHVIAVGEPFVWK